MDKKRMKLLLVILFVFNFFVTFDFHAIASDDPPRTNIQLIDEIFEAVSFSVMSHIPTDKAIHLQIHYPGYEWFIRNRLIDLIQNEGYKIDLFGENDEYIVFVEIGVEELRVRYNRVYRQSTFGKRFMEREVIGIFSINIDQSPIPIVYRMEENVRDNVPLRLHDEIENPLFPFTRSSVPDDSVLDRIIGPVVIIGATAVAIYLFFSVRS